MAREVWIKADVYGLETLKDGTLKPVARCGHYETGPEIVWAVLDAASRLHDLECWAKGIVNSSNNLLVHACPDGYGKPATIFPATSQSSFCLPRNVRNVCAVCAKNFAALKMICPVFL